MKQQIENQETTTFVREFYAKNGDLIREFNCENGTQMFESYNENGAIIRQMIMYCNGTNAYVKFENNVPVNGHEKHADGTEVKLLFPNYNVDAEVDYDEDQTSDRADAEEDYDEDQTSDRADAEEDYDEDQTSDRADEEVDKDQYITDWMNQVVQPQQNPEEENTLGVCGDQDGLNT